MVEVTIKAPARLHLGFVDLNGSLGRRFGSLGVAITGIETSLTVADHTLEPNANNAHEYARAARAADRLCEYLGEAERPNFRLNSIIPPHAGLGSGTQLALAVGRGLAALYQNPISTREIAALTGRGARSGIGVGVFDAGGFVVDVGRGASTDVPPQLVRADFPAEWPVVLLGDPGLEGISGHEEKAAFNSLAPMSDSLVAELCRHTLMGVIPAVMERDFENFATSLGFIQQAIGDYFAPFQGGRKFTSIPIGTTATEIKRRWPQVVIGQSSWGPTVFALVESEAVADEIVEQLQYNSIGSPDAPWDVQVSRVNNSGALVASPVDR